MTASGSATTTDRHPIHGGITATGSLAPALFADKLKASSARVYGTAGPAFVRELVMGYGDAAALTSTVKSIVHEMTDSLTPKDTAPEHRRTAKRFALVHATGQLAVKHGVLNASVDDIDRAVREAFGAWLVEAAEMADVTRGVLNVSAFAQRNEARFQKLHGDDKLVPQNRAGYVGPDAAAHGRAFLFLPDAFIERVAVRTQKKPPAS
jgi:hypothetical protein